MSYQPQPQPRVIPWPSIIFGASVILALYFLLWPVKFQVFGTTVDCGMPIAAVDVSFGDGTNDLADSVTQRCHTEGKNHLTYGGATLLIGGVAAAAISTSMRRRYPQQYPPR